MRFQLPLTASSFNRQHCQALGNIVMQLASQASALFLLCVDKLTGQRACFRFGPAALPALTQEPADERGLQQDYGTDNQVLWVDKLLPQAVGSRNKTSLPAILARP